MFDNHYGNVIICFQIAYGVGFLIAGRVIDRLGTKTGYAVAIMIWALSSMSHSLVTSVAGFCVARIFLGLGESGNFPAAIKATTEWFPTEERGKAVGLFNSGSNVSFFLAPLLIGFATAHYGWRASFLATGSLGMLWLVVWMLFPYNRLRRGSTQTQANLEADFASQSKYGGNIPLMVLLQRPGTYAFAIGKGLTDGVWWFYLFYLPQFLNRNYGLDLKGAYWFIVTVYVISSVGSIFGGSLSGWLMARGYSINGGRKLAMLSMAILVLPLVFVPHMGDLSRQPVARDPADCRRRCRSPGLVGESLLHSWRHVPVDRRLDDRWHWRRRRSRRRGLLYLDCQAQPVPAPAAGLRPGRRGLPYLAGNLPSAGAAPRRRPGSQTGSRVSRIT